MIFEGFGVGLVFRFIFVPASVKSHSICPRGLRLVLINTSKRDPVLIGMSPNRLYPFHSGRLEASELECLHSGRLSGSRWEPGALTNKSPLCSSTNN